jgi:DNA-directed RNA polymerase subunit RPC12/RpoP
VAMKPCRECGTEVSDQASKCPQCGIAKPVMKPKRSIRKIILGVIVGSAVIVAIVDRKNGGAAPTQHFNRSTMEAIALKSLEVESIKYQAGGFGNVLLVSMNIKNTGALDVKDLTVECTSYGRSETPNGSLKTVLYERVKASTTLRVKGLNMGIVAPQSNTFSCEITDVHLG